MNITTPQIAGYPHRTAGHCGSGAMRDLLHWAGLGFNGPPGEALVFGLSGGMSFQYTRSPGLQPPIYFVGRNADMELDLCRRLGIRAEARRTEDPAEGWQWLAGSLDAGRPVLIHTDIAELPYLRVRLSNTRHSVVAVGYDREQGIAWLVDNDRENVQEVPLDALARARHSHGFPDPNRHATFPMTFPDRLPELLPTARDAAAQVVRQMRESTGPLFDPDILPADAVSAGGLHGVRAFADDLARWPEVLDPDTRSEAVRALPVFVEKAGTGGGLFRRLQAGFCDEVAQKTGEYAFAEAARAYGECADAWSRLAANAAAETLDFDALLRAAEALPGAEEHAVAALEKVLPCDHAR